MEKSLKKAHSEERMEPSTTLNRIEQNNTEQEQSEKWPHKTKGKKRNTLTWTSTTKVVKKKTHTTKLLKTQVTKNRKLFIWGVSRTHPMLASLYREFLLYIWCWLLYVEGFSYMSHAVLFMLGVYLTHPLLAASCREFLLHILCLVLYVGSFSYNPLLASLCGEFLLHIPCWLPYVGSFSYTSCAGFLMCGVSLTHPVLASLCVEFLLHILCWLPYVWSFSYTSCAGFFVWRVSLTCTVLVSSCGEFLLHIPCWPPYVGYFSYISMLASLWFSFLYTSCAGCIMWGVSLTCPMLAV